MNAAQRIAAVFTALALLALGACGTREASVSEPMSLPVVITPTILPTLAPTVAAATPLPEEPSAIPEVIESTLPWRLVATIPFSSPLGLDLDSQGNLYVVDTLNERIHKLDPSGNQIAAWGRHGNGEGQFVFNPPADWTGPNLIGGFLAVGPDDIIYVSDTYNRRVQTFRPDGTFNGMWSVEDTSGQPEIVGPLVVTPSRSVYIGGLNGLYQYDSNGALVQAWGITENWDNAFSSLTPGAVGGDGALYLFDILTAQIAVMEPDGRLRERWGTKGEGEGQFLLPVDVAIDRDGNIYVVDNSPRVQVFNMSGKYQGQWVAPSSTIPLGSWLGSLAFGSDGRLYVGDAGVNAVYILEQVGP